MCANTSCRFHSAFEERVAATEGQLSRLKQRNAQTDDEAGRRVDQATAEISGAHEAMRSKQDQLQRNSARQQQLQSQVRHLHNPTLACVAGGVGHTILVLHCRSSFPAMRKSTPGSPSAVGIA